MPLGPGMAPVTLGRRCGKEFACWCLLCKYVKYATLVLNSVGNAVLSYGSQKSLYCHHRLLTARGVADTAHCSTCHTYHATLPIYAIPTHQIRY